MSEFDTSVAQKAWQDPALALQIAGLLAPNITHTRNTLYGPQRSTIDIRNALSGFGQMYGGLQQKKENQDLMTWMAQRAASQQQMPRGSEVPYSEPNVPWAMGEAQGAPTLPERATLPISFTQQATELAKPIETSAQTLMAMSPKQREVYFRGATGATPGPMMAQYARQRAETEGIRQRQRTQIGLQAMERVAANPLDDEASKVLTSLLGDMSPETTRLTQAMFTDQRFRVSARKMAEEKGLPLFDDPATDRQTLSALLVAKEKEKDQIATNHSALDAFEKRGDAQGVNMRKFTSALRGLADVGQPLSPEILANAENMVAVGLLVNDFPGYVDAKAAWKPLSVATYQAMQAKEYWPMVRREVDMFQEKAIEFQQKQEQMKAQTTDQKWRQNLAEQEQSWRLVASTSDDLARAQQVWTMAQDKAAITQAAGWKVSPTATTEGEVSDMYKKNVLLPAEQRYQELRNTYEIAKRGHFQKYLPGTLATLDIRGLGRNIADVMQLNEPPATKLQRLEIMEQRLNSKPGLDDSVSYAYGPQVKQQALTMIAEAKRQVQALIKPPEAEGKISTAEPTEAQALREKRYRQGRKLFGPPMEPYEQVPQPQPRVPPAPQAQVRSIIKEVMDSVPEYRGKTFEQLVNPEDRRNVMGMVNREILRRKAQVDAEVAARSFTPPAPVGAMGP